MDRASRRKLFDKLNVLYTLENNLSALAILYASVDAKIQCKVIVKIVFNIAKERTSRTYLDM